MIAGEMLELGPEAAALHRETGVEIAGGHRCLGRAWPGQSLAALRQRASPHTVFESAEDAAAARRRSSRRRPGSGQRLARRPN